MHLDKKTEATIIIGVSLLFGVIFWIADSFFELYHFHENLRFLLLEGPETFMESLIFKISPHTLFLRIAFIIASLMAGLLTALLLYQRRTSEEDLISARVEQRRLEEKYDRSKKMEALGLLAGGVAHDLNNILSGVISYPELMMMDPSLGKHHREMVHEIKQSGHRAAAVVSDLLTIARGVAQARAPLAMGRLIEDYLASPECRQLINTHPDLAIRREIQIDAIHVLGSDIHIRKTLMNLVSNAAEAMGGAGVITIRCKGVGLETPLSGYMDIPAGEYALMSVSDTGGGISAEDMNRIFEPFYTRKAMGRSGTGLGLTVVWNMVRDHAGHIDVASGPAGTTFSIYLPVTRERPDEPGAAPSITDLKGNGETVLIIDDEATQRDIARRMLEKLGYRPEAVESGEKAILFLKQRPMDLLLLDMAMDPGMNGRQAYEKILEFRPGQKALIASGYAETDDVRSAQQKGADGFIMKPYTLEKLGLAVKSALSATGPSR